MSAKVGEKSGKEAQSRGKVGGICAVAEMWLWQLNKMLVTKLWRGRNTVTTDF